MILHASLTVDIPRNAAEAIAELMGGKAFPFRELGADAWIAISGDDHGTLVEFLKRGTEFHYVPDATVAHRHGDRTRESGNHLLIETPYDVAQVLAIAKERECQAHVANHGPLQVVEFWIERCVLVEVATPQQAAAYRKMATLANVQSMVGSAEDVRFSARS